eukprot:m.698180 g.698180  ORF g.698180 m.698180 type:complete len:356 (+) comp22899_c1_seq8:2039-3106(+)
MTVHPRWGKTAPLLLLLPTRPCVPQTIHDEFLAVLGLHGGADDGDVAVVGPGLGFLGNVHAALGGLLEVAVVGAGLANQHAHLVRRARQHHRHLPLPRLRDRVQAAAAAATAARLVACFVARGLVEDLGFTVPHLGGCAHESNVAVRLSGLGCFWNGNTTPCFLLQRTERDAALADDQAYLGVTDRNHFRYLPVRRAGLAISGFRRRCDAWVGAHVGIVTLLPTLEARHLGQRARGGAGVHVRLHQRPVGADAHGIVGGQARCRQQHSIFVAQFHWNFPRRMRLFAILSIWAESTEIVDTDNLQGTTQCIGPQCYGTERTIKIVAKMRTVLTHPDYTSKHPTKRKLPHRKFPQVC